MTRSATRLTFILMAILPLTACGGSSDTGATSTTDAQSTTTVDVTTSIATTTTIGNNTSTTYGVEPAEGDLLVVGDWGSGTVPQGAVAGAMQRYSDENEVTAIVTTGDNFYSDDVEFLMQPFFWVEDADIEWWVTWGNHDVESEARIDAVNDTFDNPPRWGVYRWGDIDVVVLDSNQVTSIDQAAFLLTTLGARNNPTVVVLHHPPFSCSHHGDTVELSKRVVEVFDDDVVLVLSGHDHNYQRFEYNDIAYIVSGGGGRGLYEIDECPPNHPEPLAGAELHHFLTVRRDGSDAITVTAYDVNGAVLDEFSIDLS